MRACVIMHNMIVEDEGDEVVTRHPNYHTSTGMSPACTAFIFHHLLAAQMMEPSVITVVRRARSVPVVRSISLPTEQHIL
jgi:hypothetical protein